MTDQELLEWSVNLRSGLRDRIPNLGTLSSHRAEIDKFVIEQLSNLITTLTAAPSKAAALSAVSDQELRRQCQRIEDLHAGHKLKSTWANDVLDIARALKARLGLTREALEIICEEYGVGELKQQPLINAILSAAGYHKPEQPPTTCPECRAPLTEPGSLACDSCL